MRKKASNPHEAEVGEQRTYNPDGQAGQDRGLRSGAKARPDGSIYPDQYNATDESEHVEPDPHVWRKIRMPERLHPLSPLRRQQYAIYEVTQDIRNEPGNDTRDDYTTHVEFSHTFSLSNRISKQFNRHPSPACCNAPRGSNDPTRLSRSGSGDPPLRRRAVVLEHDRIDTIPDSFTSIFQKPEPTRVASSRGRFTKRGYASCCLYSRR